MRLPADRRLSATRTTRDARADRTLAREAVGHTAIELLQQCEYERLADLMRQTEAADRFADGHVSAQMLDAARLMSEACLEGRAEAAWHEEALTRLSHREHELTEKLEEIIRLVRDEAALGSEAVDTSREVDMESFGGQVKAAPSISVHCLGPFQVYFEDQLVEDWPNGKGKAIFKFLVARRDRATGKEILMDRFWPGAPPDAARNNLNVSIYSVRRAFARINRTYSVILFQNDCYRINPELGIWLDYEAFLNHLAAARAFERRGETAFAAHRYRCADVLYRGEFLEEDRYEDWVEPLRTTLRDEYLAMLDRLTEYSFEQGDYGASIALCGRMLEIDACRESPHQQLMRCWSRQGLLHLALRQYQVCTEALERELRLEPSEATTDLFERIRRREPV